MKLSRHYTLQQLTRSETATRRGFNEQFDPPQSIVNSLRVLCEDMLDLLADALEPNGNIVIRSGYRSPRLNAAVGGASSLVNGKMVQTSQHVRGEAVDIEYIQNARENNMIIVQTIISKNIPFDQMIIEFGTETNPDWIHLSYSEGKNRGQILRATKQNGRTIYTDVTSRFKK